MTKTCFVHIGFHKTGSTSIQNFLQINRKKLTELGFDFYKGQHIDQNHVELHASTMNFDRSSTFRLRSGLRFGPDYLEKTRQRMANYFQDNSDANCIFSAEGLSLLRYEAETDRLASILNSDVRIIAYLRNKADYQLSHAGQLKRAGQLEGSDKDSYAYLGDDSWMLNYGSRLAAYKKTFGEANICVIDYDEACRFDGNVIPSLLRELEIDGHFPEESWKKMRLNHSQ